MILSILKCFLSFQTRWTNMNDAFRRLCWFYRLPNWNCSQMPFENSHHFILMNEAICSRPSHYWNQPWPIINLIAHYQVVITLVRHKKARFDTKKPGLIQKCPIRHKMPYPTCISWHCHYQTSSPFYWSYFLSLIKHFVLKNRYIHLETNTAVKTVQQRTPLLPGFHNALDKNLVIRVK